MAEQGEAPEYKVTITGTRDDALQLLSDLIENDDAREQFHDPFAARELLVGYGIDIPQEAIPEQIKLPPRRYLEEALRALTSDDPELSIFGPMPPFSGPPFSMSGVVFQIIFIAVGRGGQAGA